MSLKITDEQNYQDIAAAIRSKLGSSETFLPSEMAGAIESIPKGTDNSELKTKFIDYDGSILYEYTQEEIDELSQLPSLPTHEGLVCQEWNWSLTDIKAMGRQVIVGASFTTDDGRTRIYIDIPEYDKTVYSNYTQSQRGGVIVHWGDGTTFVDENNTAVSTSHTYENAGNYIIEIEVLDGTITISGDANSGSKLIWSNQASSVSADGAGSYVYKVEIGDGVILAGPAFKKMNAETISIPSNLQFAQNGGSYFATNPMLKCLVLPKTLTSVKSNLANGDYCLKIVSIPNTVTSIQQYAFNSCHLLKSITIPDTVWSINEYAFNECESIEELIIPERVSEIGNGSFASASGLNRPNAIPETITTFPNSCFRSSDIGSVAFDSDNITYAAYAFNDCKNIHSLKINKLPKKLTDLAFENLSRLEEVSLPEGITKMPNYFFNESKLLKEITIPSSVVEIGKEAFAYCCSLRELELPSGLTTLGTSSFEGCESIREFIVPAGVISLPSLAFAYCDRLRSVVFLGAITSISNSTFKSSPNILQYDFSHCQQVPTITASSTIVVNSRTVIKVPADLYNDFTQDQYWSSLASYMVAV